MIRKIYKFGGASVKDADAVRNLKNIIEKENREDLMLVISAMGKTTNAIEKALADFRKNNGHLEIAALSEIIGFHENIMIDLFDGNISHPVFEVMTNLFLDLYLNLQETGFDYDYQYDNTVSFGEILSTTLISAYLNECGIKNELIDAREYVITDHNFRAANPDWDDCRLRIDELNKKLDAYIDDFLKASPDAIRDCKHLIRNVGGISNPYSGVFDMTAQLIAQERMSDDAQERMREFLKI